MLHYRVEIAIVLEKLISPLDAIGSDDHVDGLAYRNALISQPAIIAGSLDRQSIAGHAGDDELLQASLDRFRMRVIAGTLQDLKQHDILGIVH